MTPHNEKGREGVTRINLPWPDKKGRVCSVAGCSGRVVGQGLCNPHYRRMRRHGDPLGGRTVVGTPTRFLSEVVLPFSGDECLAWPFNSKRGYGMLTIDGKQIGAHRAVCLIAKGPPPTPSHEVAHTCGNGHLACVNPRHLEWKTRAANHADKLVHGTHNRGSRNAGSLLTDDAVREIRALRGAVSGRDLARRFGVSPTTICNVQKRTTWSWL